MMKRIICLCLLLPFIAVLMGCSPSVRSPAVPEQTASPTSGEETSPSPIRSPVPTETRIPTATPTPTVRPATPTISITPTLTRPVRLESKEAKEAIQKLLKENVKCASPCIWGIIPDQTTLGEAQNVFRRLGFPLQKPDFSEQEFYETGYSFSNGLTVSVALWIAESIVTDIQFDIGLANYRNPPVPREWSAFSPETLVRSYGIPTKVSLNITYPVEDGFPPGLAWYDMVMYFNSPGLFVEYDSGVTQAGKLVQACPLIDEFYNVRVWLGKNPEHPPLEGLSLEKTTSLTMEQFSELLTENPAEAACFSIKADAFIP